MIRIGLLGLVIVIVIAVASSASAEKAIQVVVTGVKSCGEWQRVRSSEMRDAQARSISNQTQAWVAGFLSGVNFASSGPDFLTPLPDSDALAAWMDNYCKSNPLDSTPDAAVALATELLSRAKRK